MWNSSTAPATASLSTWRRWARRWPLPPRNYGRPQRLPPTREVYKRNVQIATQHVQELINQGVAQGEFRTVNAVFAADLTTTMMVRIQHGEVRANTGLDDAHGHHELASFITAGNQRVGRRHVFHADRRQSVADLPNRTAPKDASAT